MNMADDPREAPQHRNGTAPASEVEDGSRVDRKMVLFVIGGILLAFTVGLCILVTALMIDWQK
jgi:hypothetical protein